MTESRPGPQDPARESYTLRTAHHGLLGDAFGLALIVLLLKLITLGVYHFWGRTRIRRYLWSQTEWEGERTVYTGTGRELMLGYARAFVLVILPLYLLYFGLEFLGRRFEWIETVAGFLSTVAFFYLTGVAVYASWRYRLSRTVWRGIRFGLVGSPWGYGRFSLWMLLLAVVTGGLYVPYMQCRTTERIVSAARFGTERFAYDGKGGDLVPSYLRAGALSGALFLIGILGVAVLAPHFFSLGIPVPGLVFWRSPWLLVLPPLGFVLDGLALAATWIAYQGACTKYHVAHTSLGPLHFRLDFHWVEYVRLKLGNFALLGMTLGVALPVTAVRTARFFAARLQCAGALDYATIAQNPQPLGKTGEGLMQVFDLSEL